jgi:hypothetical protein
MRNKTDIMLMSQRERDKRKANSNLKRETDKKLCREQKRCRKTKERQRGKKGNRYSNSKKIRERKINKI